MDGGAPQHDDPDVAGPGETSGSPKAISSRVQGARQEIPSGAGRSSIAAEGRYEDAAVLRDRPWCLTTSFVGPSTLLS